MTIQKGLKKSLAEAARAIQKSRRVLVASHVNPDGDTIGCMLALGLALNGLGKQTLLLCQDGVPSRFQFLPASELILSGTSETADLSIAVDCGSITQLGTVRAAFQRSRQTIQIDHHDFGEAFGKIQVFEHEAAAVGEIVYELLRELKVAIDGSIATCLLTSIIIDTGAFRFSNIRPKTFEICGKLLKTGIDLRRLIEESYWSKSRSTSRLTSFCLLNAQYLKDGAIAWSTVTQSDIQRFGAKLSDADSVPDDLRSVEGVKIAVMFRQTEKNRLRVSLRSQSGINVAGVAKKFGGGGHHSSAGCVIRGGQEKARLLADLETLLS